MILHLDLFVQSMDEMIDFYVSKFGFELMEDSIVEGDLVRYMSKGKYNSYRLALLKPAKVGTMIELLEYQSVEAGAGEKFLEKKEATSPVTITLLVPSIELKVKRLRQLGIEPDSEIFYIDLKDAGKSKIIFFEDPEHNKIELLEMVSHF